MLFGLPFLKLPTCPPRLPLSGLVLICVWLVCGHSNCFAVQRGGATSNDAEIAELIEGLASDSYAMRIRCRDRLMRIGLAAFDQLREARNHPDSEVAIVARRLTSGLHVEWSTSSDTSEVRDLLTEYGSQGVTQRSKRIEAIAELPRGEAFSPLLRLARFEQDPVLARTAVLALIGLDGRSPPSHESISAPPRPDDDSKKTEITSQSEAAQIENASLQPLRISSEWLLQYAADLRSGQLDVPAWEQLIAQNREQLAVDDSDAIDEFHVSGVELLALVRATAERALARGDKDDAVQIMVANVDLISTKTQRLIETATWALDHALDRVVIAIYESYPELVEKSAILLYSVAEAFLQLDRESDATKLANAALSINPLSQQGDTPMHPQTIEYNALAHIELASELVERGLFRWGEQEYNLVIDHLPVDTVVSSYARLRLATMFGDMQRHADVVKTLTPMAERIDQDDEFRDRLIARRMPYTDVQSTLDFHRGLLLIDKGEVDAAKPVLRKAYELNKENIDILIAMYQLEGDQQWKESVARMLDAQIKSAQSAIDNARTNTQGIGLFRTSPLELAQHLNTYAWLVSNTSGDTAKALLYSKESLKLSPGRSALMDTCARCYFAEGDLEAAVEMQAEACRLTPHSPPLLRQLKEFQDALQAS